MTKRLTTIIVVANVIMGLLLYLSSQLVLFNINSPVQNPVTVAGFNIFTIYLQPPQVGSGVILPIVWGTPNYPFYAFATFLVVNACFIIILLRNKETK
ncbi:MAG: hypothetical protein ABSA79_05030 [Candidatus Bathyarchaeia archaeon]|jgi:hypothetical protein